MKGKMQTFNAWSEKEFDSLEFTEQMSSVIQTGE